ncbi:predicted protein [Arabidopsis lyrata subsp. lyrata]|uniref:Predicted protein n=1 Tax=Arabidopsis lyrata subsp. lyrata TaxID=81972 RepID=D7KJ11_ARALL|nr:predicted protein [Arabidopsis lyrata subsp. lyrata]
MENLETESSNSIIGGLADEVTVVNGHSNGSVDLSLVSSKLQQNAWIYSPCGGALDRRSSCFANRNLKNYDLLLVTIFTSSARFRSRFTTVS